MKRALLILHGFAGSPKSHLGLMEYVENKSDVDVFTFIMPGHKENEICKSTKEDYINKTEDELKKIINLGYEDITIYGFSMGGSIATYIGFAYPEVTRLIMADPSYAFTTASEKKTNKVIYKKEKSVIESNARLSPKEFFRRFPPIAQIHFLELRKFCNKFVKFLNKPTLYIHGSDDELASMKASTSAFLLNKNENKTYVALNGATHDIYSSEWQELIYSLVCKFAGGEDIPLGYFDDTNKFLKEIEPKR